MRQTQGVLWTKGTLLSPQHLQTQDRFLEDLLEFRTASLAFRPWGFRSLEVDREALEEGGALALSQASGLFPDGLAFHLPGGDPTPPPRSLDELWEPDQEAMTFYLTIPERRQGGRNVGAERTRDDARFLSEVELLRDENTGQMEKPVQVARKNLRILAETENREGATALPLARVKRNPAGELELDPRFVPPLLNIEASEYLMAVARRLLELLTARAGALASSRRERAGGLADFGSSNVANFWLLYTLNSALPRFRHLFEVKRGHPVQLFQAMLELGGALATFSSRVSPADFPTYDHLDLGATFTTLDEQVRELLETVVPANHVVLPLQPAGSATYATALEKEEYLRAPQLFLAMQASGDQNEILRKAPQLLKVAAADRVNTLVRQALPGMRLNHVPNPPDAVPVRRGHHYFSLEKGEEWEAIRRARNLSVYVPSDFQEPKLELVLILPETRS
jgi:type VI secretion system protein ImpJ